MPGEWKTLSLSELYDFSSGLSKPSSEFGSGDPFLTFKDVLDNYFVPDQLSGLVNSTAGEQAKCSIRRGDVFLTRTSETQPDLGMSSVAIRDHPKATFNGFTKRLRPKSPDLVWPEYAAYYFRGPNFRQAVTSMSTLSTRASLNNEMLSRLTMSVPPLQVQKVIGAILKSLDDKIELNRRMNRTLEATARAVFRAWFVDFEPVKAKAAGASSFPGMPQPVFDQLPAELVESDLGPIPAGWTVKRFGEVLTATMGQSPPSEYYNERGEGLPFHQGVTDYGFRFPTHRVYCTLEARIAEARDVLVSVRAPVGRINVADRRLIVGRGLAAVRHPLGYASYTLYLLKHLFAEEDAVGDGTIYKAVTKEFLLSMPVLEPSAELVAAAEHFLAPVDALIQAAERESVTLAAIRDVSLPRLISGEVRIPAIGGRSDG